MSPQSDQELLRAIRHSDEKAFAELFSRYWEYVYTITYKRIQSEEVTKELVQDLFVSLWNKRATLSIEHLPSYLYICVKNRVLNHVISQNIRKKHWDYYKSFIPEQDIVTDNDVELNELMQCIEEGIDHLPEKSQKVSRLSLMEGRSITEIAILLNLSEKSIYYHLTQSIKKLRVHLKNITLSLLFFLH